MRSPLPHDASDTEDAAAFSGELAGWQQQIIIVTRYLDHSFNPKIIIYTKILCHLAYDTLDPIYMILFICRRQSIIRLWVATVYPHLFDLVKKQDYYCHHCHHQGM